METLHAFSHIYRHNKRSKIKYWTWGFFIIAAVVLFLPWTQNVRAKGRITTLRMEQRPQEVNSIIPGKIAKWFVKEGDWVKAGDTLLQITEVKDDYLDPDLLNRTGEQLSAKKMSLDFYKNKVDASGEQIAALTSNRQLKLQQLKNKIAQLQLKIQSDSAELMAASNDFNIASRQFKRQQVMYDSGLVSLTQLEQRNTGFQNSQAKRLSAENKLNNTRQELTIAQIEMTAIEQDYAEKVAKAKGEQFQSLGQAAGNQADIAKLQNQYSNYTMRRGMYFITAPQSGQVIKAKKAGIGEMIKDAEMLVEIVPQEQQFAAELFIKPVDLPLISLGQRVQFLFDGFPAIVFSGWPNSSYGTFTGKVAAIENAAGENGYFRILVTEDENVAKKWPAELKTGTGAQGFALLKNVPVWYELWRNVNGFPPDYYKNTAVNNNNKKDYK